jgi:phosphate transport system permease protein
MKDKILERCLYLAGLFAVSLSVLILFFLIYFSLPLFQPAILKNILSFEWQPLYGKFGILPMALTSIILAVLAVTIALPIGLGISCLLSSLANKDIAKIGDILIRFMTSIPTVIYGFVSIFVLIPFIRDISGKGSGFCLLSAIFVLSILILPTMVLLISDSFKSVPKSYIESSKALGFTPIQELIYIIIPYSKFGIINAVILGFGRAIGDTMIALMIAGNAAQVPYSFFDSVRTLTAQIALVLASDTESLTFKSIFASGLILFIFMLLASLSSYFIIHKKRLNQ